MFPVGSHLSEFLQTGTTDILSLVTLLWGLSCALWHGRQHAWFLSTRFQEHPSPELWQPKMSSDMTKSLRVQSYSQLRTTDLNQAYMSLMEWACLGQESPASGPQAGTSCQIGIGIRLEIKCTVDVMYLNLPQTIPLLPLVCGKTVFPWNWFLVPKRLGIAGIGCPKAFWLPNRKEKMNWRWSEKSFRLSSCIGSTPPNKIDIKGIY